MPKKKKIDTSSEEVVDLTQKNEVSDQVPAVSVGQISADQVSNSEDQVVAPVVNQSIVDPMVNEMAQNEEVADLGGESDASSAKWVVIIVILLLLLVAMVSGAFYYYSQYVTSPKEEVVLISPEPDTKITPVVKEIELDAQTDSLDDVSDSDEIIDLEKDLEETDLDEIDQEVNEIDQELDN